MREQAMQHVTRGTPGVVSLRGCALYDRADGAIRHMHRVATLEGAEETGAEEMEARMRAIAAECGIDEGRLEAIHFDPAELEPGQRYQVDPETKRMVAKGPIGGGRQARAD
jgi:hypothetical protein